MSKPWKSWVRRHFAALLTCTTLVPSAAIAQSAPGDRIDAIERQIQDLQGQLRRLKSDLDDSRQQVRRSREDAERARAQAREAAAQARQQAESAAVAQAQAASATAQAQAAAASAGAQAQAAATTVQPAAPKPGGDIGTVGFPKGRPTFTSADGRASLAIGGQVQFDMADYLQSHGTAGDNRQYPHLNNGENLRRGRLFFVARYDDFTLNITPDFGGSPDGSPSLYEANINYSGIKPLTLTLGYFKPWFTLQDSMSSNDFLFLERPSIIEIARSDLAAGDARASLGGRVANDDYFAAAYLTGGNYGAQTSHLLNDEQTGGTLRLAGRPYHDEDWNIHAGFSGEMVFHPGVYDGGTAGSGRTTVDLLDRPELRVDQNRLIDTGTISSRGASEYGGELAASWRNVLVQGEFLHINVDQSKLPGLTAPELGFDGGYVEASWVLTGERRPYVPEQAAFARPKVADPFSFDNWGGGAWELASRYSYVDLNSDVVRGISQSVTGGVYGGKQQIVSFGLSWYPNDWLRFMLDYDLVDVNRLNTAGTVQIGQRYQVLAGRAQVAW